MINKSAILQPGIVTDILKKIEKQHNLNTQEEAIVMLALLFQQGGTARSCDGNMTVTIFDQEFKLANIRKILKDCLYAKGEHKLARSLVNDITHSRYNNSKRPIEFFNEFLAKFKKK